MLYLLPCGEIVLRAVLKGRWLDSSGKLLPDAYIRDPKKDVDGLSVAIQSESSVEAWLTTFRKSFGADSLHCGRIVDLGLQVGQTEEDVQQAAGHSVIVGVPYQDDDPGRAESLASALAEISRRVDRIVRKQKEPS
jgi:hypothetical protein